MGPDFLPLHTYSSGWFQTSYTFPDFNTQSTDFCNKKTMYLHSCCSCYGPWSLKDRRWYFMMRLVFPFQQNSRLSDYHYENGWSPCGAPHQLWFWIDKPWPMLFSSYLSWNSHLIHVEFAHGALWHHPDWVQQVLADQK